MVYTMDPGESVTDYVGVSNFGDEELTVQVYASDAFVTEDGRFDLLVAAEQPTDVGSWVEIENEVVIPGRSRADIPFRLSVPKNATPGDHAGGIVASVRFEGEGSVTTEQRVGSRIYLRVTGDLDPQLEVRDLVVRYEPTLNPLAPGRLLASYTVENTGNVRLSGVPTLTASGTFGLVQTATDVEPLPELLPGTVISRSATLDGVWPLGPMTGTLQVAPSAVDPTLAPRLSVSSTSASFWAVPWVHLALLAALTLIGLRGWRRKLERRRMTRAKPGQRTAASGSGA